MTTTPGLSGADRTERTLARLAERVDAFTHQPVGHSWRIARIAERVARRFRFHETEIADLRCAALARGFGYYALRLAALDRPGPLDFMERLELWRHPLLAEQQLARRGGSRHAQLLVRWHHEWWNGLGYPDMLSGDAIPPGARILRAVETYLAMRTDRPHRSALDGPAARRALAERSGIEIDPRVAAAVLEALETDPDAETALPDPVEGFHLRPIAPVTPDEPR